MHLDMVGQVGMHANKENIGLDESISGILHKTMVISFDTFDGLQSVSQSVSQYEDVQS